MAHDHYNIVCAAVNPEEMTAAVRALGDLGGGMVAVENGRVLSALPLPYGDLISDLPLEQVVREEHAVTQAARSLGATLR